MDIFTGFIYIMLLKTDSIHVEDKNHIPHKLNGIP